MHSLTDTILSYFLDRLFCQLLFLRDDHCWKCTQISLHILICLLSKLIYNYFKTISNKPNVR